VLERAAVLVSPTGDVEARFTVGLPFYISTVLRSTFAPANVLEQTAVSPVAGLDLPQKLCGTAYAAYAHMICSSFLPHMICSSFLKVLLLLNCNAHTYQ
jgi:hypothetical protein